MLAFVLVGFGSNAVVNPDTLLPMTVVIVLHGLVMVGWFSLFVAQAGLIRSRNRRLHMRLGHASTVLAIAVVITGVLVTLSGFQRSQDGTIAMVNVTALATFSILYVLAYAKRRNPETHKRLMLLGGIRMLAPAAVRVCLALGLNAVLTPIIVLLFAASLGAFDIARSRRIHPATALGTVVIMISVALVPTGTSAGWLALLRSLT